MLLLWSVQVFIFLFYQQGIRYLGPCSLGSFLLIHRDLQGIPGRWSPVLSGFSAPVPDDFGVNGARDTVVQLGVELGQSVASVHAVVGDIPDSRGLDDVPDHELADGLVLGASLGAVGAPDGLDVPTVVLVASVVPALLSHLA